MNKRLDNKVILLVDDEPELRSAIAFELESEGALVTEAGSGKEALKEIENKAFHLVLSDVRMPNGDGVFLLDNIKRLNPDTPVVMFITGYSDIPSDEVYNKGCCAILSKPFEVENLIIKMVRALKTPPDSWLEKLDRVKVDFNIEIQCQSLGEAIRAKTLNVSKGGMFVAESSKFPRVDDTIQFRIFQSPNDLILTGKAIVRWTRSVQRENLPTGYGIEFYDLDKDTIDAFTTVILELKNKIPYIAIK